MANPVNIQQLWLPEQDLHKSGSFSMDGRGADDTPVFPARLLIVKGCWDKRRDFTQWCSPWQVALPVTIPSPTHMPTPGKISGP